MLRATRALAEALFATENGPPPAGRLDWVDQNVDDFLSRSGPRARLVFGTMILFCSLVAPLLVGRLRPLGALPLRERITALSRLEQRFGEPLLAAKTILCLVYYEHPDAAKEVGFDGQCLLGARVGGASP